VRSAVVSELEMAALRTAAAKRVGLSSRPCDDTMLACASPSLPAGTPHRDGDPQFSIRRFP